MKERVVKKLSQNGCTNIISQNFIAWEHRTLLNPLSIRKRLKTPTSQVNGTLQKS